MPGFEEVPFGEASSFIVRPRHSLGRRRLEGGSPRLGLTRRCPYLIMRSVSVANLDHGWWPVQAKKCVAHRNAENQGETYALTWPTLLEMSPITHP